MPGRTAAGNQLAKARPLAINASQRSAHHERRIRVTVLDGRARPLVAEVGAYRAIRYHDGSTMDTPGPSSSARDRLTAIRDSLLRLHKVAARIRADPL